MDLDLLDNHAYRDSPVHRAPPALKLFIAAALVLALVAMPLTAWGWFLGAALALFTVAVWAGLPLAFLLKRLLLLEPLALGVSLLSLLQPHGGLVFAGLLVRSTLCLMTMILLANTTPFQDLLAMLRRARVPWILLTTLALMHRYLFVLVEESLRMRRARASRTFSPRRRLAWRNLLTVIAQLFVRSIERAERIYLAMCARGWSPPSHSSSPRSPGECP